MDDLWTLTARIHLAGSVHISCSIDVMRGYLLVSISCSKLFCCAALSFLHLHRSGVIVLCWLFGRYGFNHSPCLLLHPQWNCPLTYEKQKSTLSRLCYCYYVLSRRSFWCSGNMETFVDILFQAINGSVTHYLQFLHCSSVSVSQAFLEYCGSRHASPDMLLIKAPEMSRRVSHQHPEVVDWVFEVHEALQIC